MSSELASVVGDLEATVQRDIAVPLSKLQSRLIAIRTGWQYAVSIASSEADLKTAVQALSRDATAAWGEYEQAKAKSIRKQVNEASDRLRARFKPNRRSKYAQKLFVAVLSSPLVSLILLVMSLNALHIWIIAGVIIWCSGAGLWMANHAEKSIVVGSSILLSIGLGFNLYVLRKCFALDWEFHDADGFSGAGSAYMSSGSMDRALDQLREPTLHLPAPKSREKYESPVLTGTRQGIISQSWQGALLGLAVNIGFQVWDDLTAPAKQRAAEERARALYESQLNQFRSRSFDSVRDAVREAGVSQIKTLLDRVDQERARPSGIRGAQNTLTKAEENAQGAFKLSFVVDLVRQFNKL